MGKTFWTEENKNKLFLIYPTGTWEEIFQGFPKHKKKSIFNAVSRFKIKKEHLGRHRNGNINFLINDNFEAYYWIGFILADGYINHKTGTLKINLSYKDRKVLEKFSFISKIKVHDYKRKNNILSSEIKIMQPDIVSQLVEKFDFKPRKTYNPPSTDIIDKMTDEQFLSFLCGYIDGDGCVKKNGKEIVIHCHSSYLNFLKFVEKRLYKIFNYNLKETNVKLDKYNYTTFSFYGDLVRSLKNKILNLNIFYMERKWSRILCQN